MDLISEVTVQSIRRLKVLIAVTAMKLVGVFSRLKMLAQGSLVVEFCATIGTAPIHIFQPPLSTGWKGRGPVFLECFGSAKAFIACTADIPRYSASVSLQSILVAKAAAACASQRRHCLFGRLSARIPRPIVMLSMMRD
jgi:hypothetical protein